MKSTYFDIEHIKCKAYEPDTGEIRYAVAAVHGFGGDKESSTITELAAKLTSQNGVVVCFDLPSHGESKQEADSLTTTNCVGDLLAVASYISKTWQNVQYGVFASSFGGYVTLMASEQIKAILGEDCRFILRAPAVRVEKTLLEAILYISEEKFRTLGAKMCGFDRKMKLPFSFYEDIKSNSVMHRFEIDAIVIHGTADDIVLMEDIQEFAKLNPDFRLDIVEGADHRVKKQHDLDRVIELAVDYLLA